MKTQFPQCPFSHPVTSNLVEWVHGGKMQNAFRRHLFLLIGLLTLCLFFLVAGLDRAGKNETAHALAGPMRVAIVPMYLVWMVITMAHVAIVGAVGLPGPFGAVVSSISLAAGLAPYVLVDYILDRLRHTGGTRVSAANRVSRGVDSIKPVLLPRWP